MSSDSTVDAVSRSDQFGACRRHRRFLTKDLGPSIDIDGSVLHFRYSLYFVDVAVLSRGGFQQCLHAKIIVMRAENIDVGNTRRVKSVVKESL